MSPEKGPRGAPDRSTPVRFLRGVGPERAQRLEEAGFATAGDLLDHLPSRYEDRRRVAAPEEVDRPGTWTVAGEVIEARAIRTRRRNFVIVRARVVASGRALPLVWFNQPYLVTRLQSGGRFLLHGNVRGADLGSLEMVNPTLAPLGEGAGEGTIVPIYPSLAGLGPALTGRLVAAAVATLDSDPPAEALPEALLRRYGLPRLAEALDTLHRPGVSADVAALDRGASPAHFRLAYGELVELQLELALLRARQVAEPKGHGYRIDDGVRNAAREVLPFPLTRAQKRVLREIVGDLQRPEPMLRLLQGDVGSGKTIVAALALLIAIESGLQGAFMAPTELLAEQQFESLRRLLGERCRVALLTGSAERAEESRSALASGEIELAVGTHALVQRSVAFRRLGLAVVDEQHRFGVEQRRLLQGKGERPDVLVMTATPIPRSLALTVYGDLEVSLLDELPPGRRPVRTEVVPTSERRSVYQRLRQELEAGAQAYVVVPLIEESDEITAASLERLGEKVREFLAGQESAILHGRLPVADRERIMADFVAGRTRVLIATTVIEVGVDVPAATWMVIESAERFGLAQLHQLRGRVGRSSRPSTCVAIHGRLSESGEERLTTFASTTDGFAIAEADLRLRGPGDLLGTRQSGLPKLRVADLLAHREWVERARSDARELVDRLDEPELAILSARVRGRFRDRYEAFGGG
ncbi:MAG: ATP-dependent DNA helicase RecG [Acidobacteria bacterium]|nr:ATP-dependent DNA helicase RecG [Acidobacteriota bacterium]MCB9378799.1 ATP-dependent DNA helicase RecG [Holophagales bacterium]